MTRDFPNVAVHDRAEFQTENARQVNQLLNLFYRCWAIALFGIVNTLGLSIFERVRELGLLRAVGATRGQLRAMIRWEAVHRRHPRRGPRPGRGGVFGWTVVRASRGIGITALTLPGGQLALFVVAAALAGILAAILPGRRAARVDMLRALSTA